MTSRLAVAALTATFVACASQPRAEGPSPEALKECAEQHPKPYPHTTASTTPATPPANPTPTTQGGRVNNAADVVADMAPGFRRCYVRGLNCDRDMEGSVRIMSKIDAEGRVVSATPAGMNGLSRGVLDCLARVVKSKTFDKPDGGGATIVIPITFFPQKDEPVAPAP